MTAPAAAMSPAAGPTQRRPRVLLLAGFPNSGTTIANYMLAQHPLIFAPGELFEFPARQLKPGKICSCGAPARECPFWSEVTATLGPLLDAPAAVRMPALYTILAELSGQPWIVDIAHDLHAVRAAEALSGIDLTIVHLRRRHLAVLRSRLALNGRQGDIRPRSFGYLRQALRHVRRMLVYQQSLARRVRRAGGQAVGVVYEDLCENPRRSLALIGACTGLDFDGVASGIEAGRALVPPAHAIRGNARLRGEAVIRVARR